MEATQPQGPRSAALLGPSAGARLRPGERRGWRGGHGAAAASVSPRRRPARESEKQNGFLGRSAGGGGDQSLIK